MPATIVHISLTPPSLLASGPSHGMAQEYMMKHSRGLKHALAEFHAAYLKLTYHPEDLHLGNDSVRLMEPTVFIAPNIARVMTDAVIGDFSLNVHQSLVLQIVTSHASDLSSADHQLLMGIFGEAGTGKSQLIEAIDSWFTHLN